jgi:hypothetical protein
MSRPAEVGSNVAFVRIRVLTRPAAPADGSLILSVASWFTSTARGKGRATVTTPALSGEKGKAILADLPHQEA